LTRLRVAFGLLGAAEAAILPFFALFLEERGFGATGIGVVLALVSLAAFAASPLWGWSADRRLGSERTLGLAAAATAAVALLLFLHGRLVLAVVAVAVWVLRAPLASLADALALDWLGASGRGGYGSIRLWQSAGWAAAVVAWGAVLELAGLGAIPALYSAAILVVALWAAAGLDHRPRPPTVSVHAGAPWARQLRSLSPAFAGFLVSLLLLGATFSATFNFLALRIEGLGGGALLVGVAASLQALAEIPAMASTGRLTRLTTHRGLYVSGCAIYVAVFVGWAVISDPVAITLLKLVIGVGFALTYVGTVVIADDLVPVHLRATGQAVAKAASFGLAPVLGTLGGGFVYAVSGPRAMFLAAAAIAAAAAGLAWISVSEPRRRVVEVEPASSVDPS
jgi:MFS family permease